MSESSAERVTSGGGHGLADWPSTDKATFIGPIFKDFSKRKIRLIFRSWKKYVSFGIVTFFFGFNSEKVRYRMFFQLPFSALLKMRILRLRRAT